MNSCDQLKCFSGFVRSFKSRTTQITVRESGGMTHKRDRLDLNLKFWLSGSSECSRSLSHVDELCFSSRKSPGASSLRVVCQERKLGGQKAHSHFPDPTSFFSASHVSSQCVCVCVPVYTHTYTHRQTFVCVSVCVYI